jgi:hypothetical protein
VIQNLLRRKHLRAGQYGLEERFVRRSLGYECGALFPRDLDWSQTAISSRKRRMDRTCWPLIARRCRFQRAWFLISIEHDAVRIDRLIRSQPRNVCVAVRGAPKYPHHWHIFRSDPDRFTVIAKQPVRRR